MKMSSLKPTVLVWLLILVTFVLRIIVASTTGLGIGESYYFRGAVDLQLSYFDQPPLFFWISGLFVKFLGLNNFALRISAVLFFGGTTLLTFLSAKKLFNEWAAFWAALILNMSFVFTLPVAVWYQPDAPLMFFGMLSVYILINIFFYDSEKSGKRKKSIIYFWWILLGISVGLASLAKYHSIFIIAGGGLFIILNKENRHWLKHPGLYIAAVISIASLLPVIIWNSENHWISFLFQGSRASGSSGFRLHPEWFLRSVLGQALWLAPWIWYPTIKELFKSFKKFSSDSKYAFIFCLSVLPIAFFTIITLWSNSQYHFHWQALGYLILFMPLGFTVADKLENTSKAKKTKRWLRNSAIALIVITTFLTLQMNIGFWQTYGPREIVQKFGGTHDPTMEGFDFDQILDRFEQEGWLEQDSIFVGTTRWWQTGKVDWALKGKKDVVIFNNDPRNYAFFAEPEKMLGYDCVVVRFHSDKEPEELDLFFDKVSPREGIDIVRGGVVEMKLQVYYCENFKIPQNYQGDFPVYRQMNGKHPFLELDE